LRIVASSVPSLRSKTPASKSFSKTALWGLADLTEGHDTILLAGERVVRDLPCDAHDLRHRVLEGGEGIVERLTVGTLDALRVDLLYEGRKVMPLDLDTVLAIEPVGEVVKRDLGGPAR